MEGSRLKLFLFELISYALPLALGVYVAWLNMMSDVPSLFEPVEATGESLLVFVAVFIAFTVLVIKFARPGRISLRVTMFIAVFIGSEFVISALVGGTNAILHILLTVLFMLFLRYVQIVGVHNLGIAVGITGISALLGLGLTPAIAAVLLAFLSIYDIVAVYRTGHMVVVAERMMSSGAVFGFLIPPSFRGYLWPWQEALEERRVLLLGSGDVGLPLILVVAAMSTSLGASIITAIAALIGLALTHWMFMSQRRRMPMAALPPVAAMTILGYLLALVLVV